jgi:hypothetical protein
MIIKYSNSIIEEQNKYHLIPFELKRGYAHIAQSVKHV